MSTPGDSQKGSIIEGRWYREMCSKAKERGSHSKQLDSRALPSKRNLLALGSRRIKVPTGYQTAQVSPLKLEEGRTTTDFPQGLRTAFQSFQSSQRHSQGSNDWTMNLKIKSARHARILTEQLAQSAQGRVFSASDCPKPGAAPRGSVRNCTRNQAEFASHD